MFIQVCGAAGEVTGSCYLVEVGDVHFLVDCGMHQGGDKQWLENLEPFCFDPRAIDFVLLTHAHIDHSGLLPRLVRQGYSNHIYATPATCDLAEIMLLDSAYIQEMEAEWRTRKGRRAGRGATDPLYTQDDARKTLPLMQGVNYNELRQLAPGVAIQFHDAGHILGSAFLELRLEEGEDALSSRPASPGGRDFVLQQPQKVKVLFSGDIGQPDQPIIRDPEIIEQTDYLVMESTYGDRLHAHDGEPEKELADILREAKQTGGNVIIPAFAVGRTQELLFFLRDIFAKTDIDMPVYVDSPLATRATEVYRRHREAFDDEAWKLVDEPGGIFDFAQLHYTTSAEESKALNGKQGVIIISASGMADAGRIRHHLKHNLWRPESHVIIVGFQAQDTLGRRLLEGATHVHIFGEDIAVKAHIHDLTGLSAHADQGQLLAWASHFTPPRLTILTHGEPNASQTLGKLLEDKLHFTVLIPKKGETVQLKAK